MEVIGSNPIAPTISFLGLAGKSIPRANPELSPQFTGSSPRQWDFIFFTGSPPVGKIIHQAAAKHLTPCVLELGGKNPTIVHSSAKLKVAARRIAYGRFMNSGHICTAPDHVLVWPEVKDEFVEHLIESTHEFYGDDPQKSPDYGRVINRRNFDRLAALIGSGKIAAEGKTDAAELYIAPTVLVDVSLSSPIMQEDVFGPFLPVLEIESVEAVIKWVNDRPSPLGLYVFAEDLDVVERILDATSSGDAEINDCAIHPLHSVAWATLGWANTMAGRGSRRSPMPGASFITAPKWIPACVTYPTRNTL